MLNLQINGCSIESFILDPLLIEDLTAFLNRDFLRIPTLRLLTELCPYGDQLLLIMRRYQTVFEVRQLLIERDSLIVHHSLLFFKNWLQFTNNRDYLFDQITAVDFVTVCELCSFEGKCCMIDLIFSICDSASQHHIIRLLTFQFLEMVIDELGCFPNDICRQMIHFIREASLKCQTEPGFGEMIDEILKSISPDDYNEWMDG
jgi:hypothetical protein